MSVWINVKAMPPTKAEDEMDNMMYTYAWIGFDDFKNPDASATNVETVLRHPVNPTLIARIVPIAQKDLNPYIRVSNAIIAADKRDPTTFAPNVPSGNQLYLLILPLYPDSFQRNNAPVGANRHAYTIVR